MSSDVANITPPSSEHIDAAGEALDVVTDNAQPKAGDDPSAHLHAGADHVNSHTWLRSFFPYNSFDEFGTSWHLGNYVIDRKTGAKSFEEMSVYVRLGMHLLYYGTQQEKALHWKRTQALLERQSVKMGQQYDSPESKAHIWPFIQSFKLEATLIQLKEPDPDRYNTFNEFFARELRRDARPIAEPHDDRVISSPADCRLTVFPTVDLATKYWIKGFGFTLSRLLGSEELANQFDGGCINIARLAPQDYHRWHAPTSGTIMSFVEIPGTYYTVNPQAVNEEGSMNVFCENKRSVMILQRAASGSPIAIIAVGAMLVGSIVYNPGIDVGQDVVRGQCLGAFLYGGSTVIVLYPKNEVELDEDLIRNSTEQQCETIMRVGWRVGAGPA